MVVWFCLGKLFRIIDTMLTNCSSVGVIFPVLVLVFYVQT